MDVHGAFCQVAVSDGGQARGVGRVATTPAELGRFASGLGTDDRVVLEATGNAWAIAAILERYAGEVVLAHPRRLRAVAEAKVKTDKVDARTLAELLAADLVPRVWRADEQTLALRRLSTRRRQIVHQRTRVKNEASAVLFRNLVRPPVSDAFGVRGRRWLSQLELPTDERLALNGCLRRLDFLGQELAEIDALIAERALASDDIRRLMTIPGVDVVTAATLIGVIGDITRFPTSKHLVGYLGLHPRISQSGERPAHHGRTAKEGSAAARHVLVEAAWMATRSPGPLRAFAERTRAKRGPNIAAVALARKLAVLSWHLLTRAEDFAFQRPSLVRAKLRRLELMTGSGLPRGARGAIRVSATPHERERERQLEQQAEIAYRRLVADWQASPKHGAGATQGRAIERRPEGDPPRGKA
jgi:transposase